MKLQTVVDQYGEVYEVKTTKDGDVMLCAEWTCITCDMEHYLKQLESGRFTVC